ncbi:ubiquinone anaerobic biosynthesis accessory factor UbiT [Atopomonas sediminilitoris]|uniref:ubiquinone anaerobic biosynthesis accessory factor UbiT n=1 Tax=Atopomonas sediminilitoris TaxID=2919919 RepID=UPI001F4E0A79|nr:SCP2 sterol-binding domain-containing protein [Atopomonas sediminilitoris]MCJ8170826.1 SCP2 sterol-binding domain-containing protein [Atopomonas sediminilitoris]
MLSALKQQAAKALLLAGEHALPLAARVPQPLQRLPLQPLLNRLLRGPLQEGAFDALEGRWMRLQLRDLNLAWCMTVRAGRLQLAANAPYEATISGNWREFLLLASRQEDPDTLFFRRRLSIEGDTELGLAVKNLIDSLDPDELPPRVWQALVWLGEQAAQQAVPARKSDLAIVS